MDECRRFPIGARDVDGCVTWTPSLFLIKHHFFIEEMGVLGWKEGVWVNSLFVWEI